MSKPNGTLTLEGKEYEVIEKTNETPPIDWNDPGWEVVGGNCLVIEPEQAALESAIAESSQRWIEDWGLWDAQAGVNYPEFKGDALAWPRSEQAGAPAVILPPVEINITKPLYLPACVALQGPSGFDSAKLRFTGDGCLRVMADCEHPELGPVKFFGRSIQGIYFIANGRQSPLQLIGSHQNVKIHNCHFNTIGKPVSAIDHPWQPEQETPFGKVYLDHETYGVHAKDVWIYNNQIEFGNPKGTGVTLRGAQACRVTDNVFIYGDCGMILTEAHNCRVSGNDFYGGVSCPGMIETNGGLYLRDNSINGCEFGFQRFGGQDALDASSNVFDGRYSGGAVYERNKTAPAPFDAGWKKKGERF